MNCYVCAKSGEAVAAVAVCRSCGAGLCLDHLREAALDRPAGGTVYACSHDTWSKTAATAARGVVAELAAPNGRTRVPSGADR